MAEGKVLALALVLGLVGIVLAGVLGAWAIGVFLGTGVTLKTSLAALVLVGLFGISSR